MRLPTTPATTLLRGLRDEVRQHNRGGRILIAVDGIDGAGKTTFADRLAPLLDRPVVRASEDDFLNPAAVRHARGRESPEGFFRDSYDLGALAKLLLDPFAAGAPFRRRAFGLLADAPVVSTDEHAPPGALLLLDGLFLHRDELRERWDLSTPARRAAEGRGAAPAGARRQADARPLRARQPALLRGLRPSVARLARAPLVAGRCASRTSTALGGGGVSRQRHTVARRTRSK